MTTEQLEIALTEYSQTNGFPRAFWWWTCERMSGAYKHYEEPQITWSLNFHSDASAAAVKLHGKGVTLQQAYDAMFPPVCNDVDRQLELA